MSSNEVNSNSTSKSDKGSSNGTSLFNGVNGEVNSISGALTAPSSASILGSSSESVSPGISSGAPTQGLDQNMFMAQPTIPYSHFANPVDGSWTPSAFDPSLMTAFGFSGAGMMSGQTLANTAPNYYFPGAPDLTGIWGQDSTAATASSLMMNSFMINPLLDQQQQQQMTGSDMLAVDPIMGLGQNFANMAVNGGQVSNMMQMSGSVNNGGGGNVAAMGTGQSVAASIPSPTIAPSGGSAESTSQNTSASAPSSTSAQSNAPQPEKPKSWAAIASQPAKPRPPPIPKAQPVEGAGDSPPSMSGKKAGHGGARGVNGIGGMHRSDGHSYGKGPSGMRTRTHQAHGAGDESGGGKVVSKSASQSELVGKLKSENRYNPSELTLNTSNARFFVIKSYAEDDIHRSIKYSIWTSTDHGNRRLDQAYRDQKGKGGVYLFYSVNGSGHFCGMAQMVSEVDFNTVTGVWAQDKWKGSFKVKWIYVKDVPNNQLRHIRLENNENKPVTNSRDTQEVPLAKARQVIKIVHSYQHTTSIFDDFDHYEKKQEEDGKGT